MITDQERSKLKELMDNAFGAPTKATAKRFISSLESQASFLSGRLTPYANGKLREVISACITGSGQVRDKEHWRYCADRSWYVFESESRLSAPTKENFY